LSARLRLEVRFGLHRSVLVGRYDDSPIETATGQPRERRSVDVAGPAGSGPAGLRSRPPQLRRRPVGWLLGTAPCASPPCTSIVRTTNGGPTRAGVPADLSLCADFASMPYRYSLGEDDTDDRG
jgi:hypothetical protein